MRLGGPIGNAWNSPESWVAAVRAQGYSAAYCPVTEKDDAATIAAYAAAAAVADIVIAEVGAWSNPISPDPATSRAAITYCQERLALAEAIGARCCVNIAGSRGPSRGGPDPENLTTDTFALIVDTVRTIIDAVKPTRTVYALEAMPWVFPDSPDTYLALIDAIFGALGLAAVYWLGLTLTGKRLVAILASVLTLADGLYFVESRTGVIDIFGTVFMACAFIAFYAFLTAPPTKIRTPLLWLGLFMGLGIATKWNAVYPSVLLGVVASWRAFCLFPFNARRAIASLVAVLFAIGIVFVPALRSGSGLKLAILIAAVIVWQLYILYFSDAGRLGPKGAGEGFVQHLIWVPLGLIALPLVLYLASYIPFFLAGHTIDQLVELQRQMYYYHSHLKATHAYQSTWYQWPVVWRPVWYSVTYGQEVAARTYANGNPLLYWTFLPAVGYLTVRWWADKHPALPVLVIGFFGQWLPWALIPRIAYIYHFLPAAIFGIFAVAVVVDELWVWGKKAFAGKALAAGYVTAVLVAFIFFYPIYSSVNLTKPEFESRIWFENWR